jgi:hypothetical protein
MWKNHNRFDTSGVGQSNQSVLPFFASSMRTAGTMRDLAIMRQPLEYLTRLQCHSAVVAPLAGLDDSIRF